MLHILIAMLHLGRNSAIFPTPPSNNIAVGCACRDFVALGLDRGNKQQLVSITTKNSAFRFVYYAIQVLL